MNNVMVTIMLLTLTSVWGAECPKGGHFLGHCAKCLYNAQCPEDHFCCPYMKKCVRNGHDPCYTPIANCRPVCRENAAGYPDSCTSCKNKDFPNNWVDCPNAGLQKRSLQKTLTTFPPLDECLPQDVSMIASNVYPETEGEVVCSNAEDCALNGVESIQDCAEVMRGKKCPRFFSSRCIEEMTIDFCVCAGGEASIEREESFMYQIGKEVTPSMKDPRELCEANQCNVAGGCLIDEEVGFTCETTAYTSEAECLTDAGTWCEAFVPKPETTVEPSFLPTKAPTHAPDPPLTCPKGSTVVSYRGFDVGPDIAGCGLSKCMDRFGHRANSIKKCKKACVLHPDCRSFSYAPMNGDQYWIGKRVCTLYKHENANRLWPAVDGSYAQILCKLETRKENLHYEVDCKGWKHGVNGFATLDECIADCKVDDNCNACTIAWSLNDYAKMDSCSNVEPRKTYGRPSLWQKNEYTVLPEPLKCPKHTHQVAFMGQYAGADLGGCGLQKCPDRMGTQADTVQACFQACRQNPKCRSFTYAPKDGDISWPGDRVCTLYDGTVPTRLWPAVSGDYTQIMCVIKNRASKVQKHVSCEGKAQLGIIVHTNDPEVCAAEILKDPSLCPTGVFMHQGKYSYSWGCRCCAASGWGPHRYWSMYKVDMKLSPKLESTHTLPATDEGTDKNWTYGFAAGAIGLVIGCILAAVYHSCRSGKNYRDIDLDPTRLNDEMEA